MAKREPNEDESGAEITASRRIIRSRYLDLKNQISDERDDMARLGSDKFNNIFTQVESLHQLVRKPREQVADAEALLDLANTLEASTKSHTFYGLTPSNLVTSILKKFKNKEETGNVVKWEAIGSVVSSICVNSPGCCTMIGPMNAEMKMRKTMQRRKRSVPTASAPPKELVDVEAEGRKDTDKNMSTMFEILRLKKSVRLENLVLNRASFAQTVENIFALSFLVKDGRAEITVNNDLHHFVSPKNAPAAALVMSGEVSYNHFVFRFDYKDWLVMRDNVKQGEELMPQRDSTDTTINKSQPVETQAQSSTAIRKRSRNRGLVVTAEQVGNVLSSEEEVKVERCELVNLTWGRKKTRDLKLGVKKEVIIY